MTPRPTLHPITGQDVELLQPKLRGRLLRAGESDYESARKIHNGMIDRRPSVIVRCQGTADVMRALEFGVEREYRSRCAAGGTGYPGLRYATTAS